VSTEVVFVIIGTVVAVAGSVAGLVWWAYRRGQAAATQRAEDKARIEALERQLTETRKELAALQSRRGRS
jgi:flagellar basal body-associated protein FliL